jgi:tetratricopeptide (TPR) repeat protein
MLFSKRRFISVRSALLACALSMGFVAAPFVVGSAVAQDKEKAKGPQVSAKVGKPLKAAQDAIAAKNWKEAKAKLDEANAFPDKTPYENYAIAELNGFVAVNSQDFAGAAKAFEVTLGSEFLGADQKPARTKAVSQLYYQVKNYPKAISFGAQYLKDNPADAEMHMMIGQGHYLQNDFPNAAKSLESAIDAAEKGGKGPKEDWFQLLQSSYFEQGNIPNLTKTLERTLRYFPKVSYWDQRIKLLEKEINDSGKFDLDIYRLRIAVGTPLEADEMREMAELAIQAGLPGEAEMIMTKAAAVGAKTERDTRLINMAKNQSTSDKASLAQSEASASKAPTGEPLVKTGEAYLTYGNPAKAVELIKAGITKGPKDAERAKFRLGVSQVEAKQEADARKTFASIPATSPYAPLARLWMIKTGT